MRIAVCLKRVPDSETKVRVHADGRSLAPSGVGFDLGPYDRSRTLIIDPVLLNNFTFGATRTTIPSGSPSTRTATST